MDNKSKKSILVIEDEKGMMLALTDKLVTEGFSVLQAQDGKDGLEKSLGTHPDLILLDILMPKMTGMGFLSELRKDEWGKKVPVVILTNLAPNDRVMKNVMENKAYSYLVKADYKIEEVVGTVKKALGIN